MIDVEPVGNPSNDHEAECKVATVDATGAEREYEIGLGPTELYGKLVMEGSRVDDHNCDKRHCCGPSQAAWDAARKHFQSLGHDVK